MNVGDVCAVMDELAPPEFAYDWDRSGLNIGEPGARVSKVIVALSVTREAFTAARRARAQMIVSHHPVLWNPLKALRTDDPHTKLCLDIVNAGVACYSAHTNLDVVPGGVNHVLAERLRLKNIKPLFKAPSAAQVKLVTFVPDSHLTKVRDAVCAAGAGVIGAYTHCSFSAPGVGTFLPGAAANPFSGKKHRVNEEPERRFEVLVPRARVSDVIAALKAAHPYEEPAYDVVRLDNTDLAIGLGARGELDKPVTIDMLARFVKKRLSVSHVRVTGVSKRKVRRVAVLGGSGGGEVDRIPKGIDAYITGDVRYHDGQTALERGLAVIDAGHFGTERYIVPALVAYLKKRLKAIAVVAFDETDPFRVLV